MVSRGAPATPPAEAAEFVHAEPAAAAPADDDDVVMMPAPSTQYLAHAPQTPARAGRPAAGASVGVRKTLVPVLFTGGILLLVAAVMKYLVHPDAPLAAVPTWLAVVLAVGGAALVGVAVLNGLLVRRAEAAAEAGAAGAGSGA